MDELAATNHKGPDGLHRLEDDVAKAVEQLRRLQAENRELKKKLKEAEKQGRAPSGSSSETAWARERSEVRRRIQSLAESLGKLLE